MDEGPCDLYLLFFFGILYYINLGQRQELGEVMAWDGVWELVAWGHQDCLLSCLGMGGGTVCGYSGQDGCMANIYLHEGLAGYDGRTDVCRLAICFDMDGMEDGGWRTEDGGWRTEDGG